MELRQLRYFLSVAQWRSFTKAATHLRIAQPALSRQIRLLETELGVKLLDRQARGVTLTQAGAMLVNSAETILRELHYIHDKVSSHPGEIYGHLTVAVPPAAGEILIPPVAEEYRALYPNVSLHVMSGFSGFICDWLNEERVDVAVLHNPPRNSHLSITPLITEALVVVGPVTGTPLPTPGGRSRQIAERDSYRISDLAMLPMIVPSRSHSLRQLIEAAAAQHGFQLNVAMEVDSLGLIKSLVARGLGYSAMTYSGAYREVKEGALKATPIEPPGISWLLAMATQGKMKSVASIEFGRLLEAHVRRLVDGKIWLAEVYPSIMT